MGSGASRQRQSGVKYVRREVTPKVEKIEQAGPHEAFNRYDKDSSGTIDVSELGDLLRDLGLTAGMNRSMIAASVLKCVEAAGEKAISWDRFKEIYQQLLWLAKEGVETLDYSVLADGSPGCRIPDVATRAISVDQLKRLYAFVEANCVSAGWTGNRPDEGGKTWKKVPLTPAIVTLYDEAMHVIEPATEEKRISYVELVASGPQPPGFFVSHWWGEAVCCFIRCVEKHSMDRGLKGAFYWVCAYANNQWELPEHVTNDPAQSSFKRAMDMATGTLAIIDPTAMLFTRVWCCFELYVSLKMAHEGGYIYDVYTAKEHEHNGHQLAVGITDGTMSVDRSHARGKVDRERHFPVELLKSCLDVKLSSAQASMECDRRHILNALVGAEDLNADPVTTHEKYEEVEGLLRGRFVASMLCPLLRGGQSIAEYTSALSTARLKNVELDFCDTQIRDNELEIIATSMPECSLRLFHLSVAVECPHVSKQGSTAISRAAGQMKQLEAFVLALPHKKQHGDPGLEAFVDALPAEGRPNLQKLWIGYEVTARGAAALAGAMQKGLLPNLAGLYLSGSPPDQLNTLRCDGVKALLAGVRGHPGLLRLNLASNLIGDDGAIALADALPDSALEAVVLRDNLITDEGGGALSACLGRARRLQVLDVSQNQLSADAKEVLRTASGRPAEVLEVECRPTSHPGRVLAVSPHHFPLGPSQGSWLVLRGDRPCPSLRLVQLGRGVQEWDATVLPQTEEAGFAINCSTTLGCSLNSSDGKLQENCCLCLSPLPMNPSELAMFRMTEEGCIAPGAAPNLVLGLVDPAHASNGPPPKETALALALVPAEDTERRLVFPEPRKVMVNDAQPFRIL